MFDFLPFGKKKKTDDPLTNLDAATSWLRTIASADSYEALAEVIKSLADFNRREEPFSRERLDILSHLDEGSQDLVDMVISQYLLNPRMSRAIEARLWKLVYNFYWECARAYHSFIMDYVARPAGNRNKSAIVLITARTIRYFAEMFKWHYFRFEASDEKSWKKLHNLYGFAEFEDFAADEIVLYPGRMNRATTCEREYVQALMLGTLSNGSMYPKQLQMVSEWLENWAYLMPVSRHYDADNHVFTADLSSGSGARRIRMKDFTDKNRFWGTHALIKHIESVRAGVMNGETPAKLGLGESCRSAGCLDYMDELARQWAPVVQRIRRKFDRKHMVMQIDVVNGLKTVYEQIKVDNELTAMRKKMREGGAPADNTAMHYQEMVDLHLYGFVTRRTQLALENASVNPGRPEANEVHALERWLMEDESEGGYGATINATSNDWVRLGRLLALRPEKKTHWDISVVRRLSRLDEQHFSVGVEVLGRMPIAIQLQPRQHQTANYVVESVDSVDALLPIMGLYLPKDTLNAQASLVIDAVEYRPGRVFDIKVGGFSYLVECKELLEKNDDWAHVAFAVLAKAQGQTGTNRG